MQEIVIQQFNKQGLGEEEILLQTRLARILRNGEYDLAEAQPVLWGGHEIIRFFKYSFYFSK